ncbi:MAG TPA: hypothetical protein VMF69_24415 [Gemmataceae bacterium]|nr:hypothetical protein [Gemmataceae bacterium]
MNRMTPHVWPALWAASVLCSLVPCSAVRSAELDSRPTSWEPRVAAAKYLSPVGNLLSNEQPGQPWRTLGQHSDIHSRDLLLALPGMRASLETSPRAVELILWGNLPGVSDFSGLESAVILHDSRAFDLDFTLRRGRVLVANRKESGPVRVWLRIEGAAFQLTLGEPGDSVCLGLYSFWPRGVPFSLSPRSEDVPVRRLNILAVKGQVDVKTGGVQHSLSSPPGLSAFHWNSVNGPDAAPHQLRQLEAWADFTRKLPSSAKPLLEAVAQYRAAVKESDPRTALFDLLAAAGREKEREQAKATAEFAVFGLAAINDIDRVMEALDDPRQAEARRAAVIALRHWIGNHAGRDQLLYQYLIDRLRYPKSQAETVLQLLHNAYAAEEPETYETLIVFLNHPKLSIRELAWWHLSRLVPEDIAVPYDPAAAPAQRAKAHAAWKELIPSGSLPSRKAKKR